MITFDFNLYSYEIYKDYYIITTTPTTTIIIMSFQQVSLLKKSFNFYYIDDI
jgi:hypothetical protein